MNPPGINIMFDGLPGAEQEVVRRVALFAASCGFSAESIADIKTAVEEACLNAIEHAVPFSSNRSIDARCFFSENVLSIEIQSEGKSFVIPDEKPDIQAKVEGREPSRGWGLYLIRSLANSVAVESTLDGTSVRMNFILQPIPKTIVES